MNRTANELRKPEFLIVRAPLGEVEERQAYTRAQRMTQEKSCARTLRRSCQRYPRATKNTPLTKLSLCESSEVQALTRRDKDG